MSKVRFIGLDVHAETIAVAVAELGGEVHSYGVIPNRLESVRKLIGKLGPVKELKVCYEAGPTGYVLYWQLTELGVGVPGDRSQSLSEEVKQIAWKAQHRLNKRYKAMSGGGKNKNQIVTALGRELLGFIWAIAANVEKQQTAAAAA